MKERSSGVCRVVTDLAPENPDELKVRQMKTIHAGIPYFSADLRGVA